MKVLGGCAGIIAIGALFVLLVGGGYALTAAQYEWWLPWVANKKTEITRNTNQYVTTQQVAINGYLAEYNEAEGLIAFYKNDPTRNDLVQALKDQQEQNVIDMCQKATLIDSEYVPVPSKALMMEAGCWSP